MSERMSVYAAVASMVAVFALDLAVPAGIPVAVLYVGPILFALLGRNGRVVIAVGAGTLLLSLVALPLQPQAPVPAYNVIANRTLALAALLTVAALGLVVLRYVQGLAAAHTELAGKRRLLEVAERLAGFGAWSVDLGTGCVTWTDEVARIHELEPRDMPSLEEALAFYAPEWREAAGEALRRCAEDGTPFDQEWELFTARGRRVWVRAVGAPVRDAQGRIVEVQGALQDIDERKRMEQSVQASQRRLHEFADSMPLVVWTADTDGTVDFFGRPLLSYTGVSAEELFARAGWLAVVHPSEHGRVIERWSESVRTGEPYSIEFRIRRHDGEYRWHLTRAIAIRDASGAISKWYGTAIDIHDEKRTAERLERTLESMTDAFFTLDQEWRFTYVNGQFERTVGCSRTEVIGRNVCEAFPDAGYSGFKDQFEHARGTGEAVHFEAHYEPLAKWLEVNAYPSDEGLTVYFRDVTQRREVEEQLRQSQRLESIGQLTGGVAHDFNNLLTVIIGNAELLVERTAGDPALNELAGTIAGTAQRGAELTQRLLAFARKQALDPRPTDVNRLIAGMDGLLRRALGEHVEIELTRGAGLWLAMVDQGQLENAILNLCLNARDAMPAGGKLTVGTANARLDADYAALHGDVVPGQYVMIAISDTGPGIAPELLSRVFDPFFTTKDKAKGTGLGLAMVYGFAKQSGGHVKIYSEAGQGTTVRLYLPRTFAAPEPELLAQLPAGGGAHTVLLVEDDELVRRFACTQLASLGYTVLEAADGRAALEILRQRADIALLFTDVVMPGGIGGRELVEQAHLLRPGLKVLYTSGYTENAIVHHGRLDPGVQLLGKPYRRADLARAIARALEDDDPAPGGDANS